MRPAHSLLPLISCTLLACPPPGPPAEHAIAATLEPSPVALTVDLGTRVSITVPGGVLAAPSTFTAVEGRPVPRTPSAPFATLGSVELSCDTGNTFSAPITLEFAYDPADLDPGLEEGVGITVAFWDEESLGWRPVPAKVDTARKRLVVKTTHLSTWAYWTVRGYRSIATPGGHFTVYYPPQGTVPPAAGGSSMEAFAQAVGAAFEQAWTRYEAAGFLMPGSWFPSRLNVVLTEDTRWFVETFQVAGLVDRYVSLEAASPFYSAVTGNIVLRLSWLDTLTSVRATSAHELFHAVQNQYGSVRTMGQRLWWTEGTPDYAAWAIAWERTYPLAEQLGGRGDQMQPEHFHEPMTLNQDVHAYKLAHLLDAMARRAPLDFPALWEFVASRTDPLEGFATWVAQNTPTTLGRAWTDHFTALYLTPGNGFEGAFAVLSLGASETSKTAQLGPLPGAFSGRLLQVGADLPAGVTSRPVTVAAESSLPDGVSLEVWHRLPGPTGAATLKAVLVGNTVTAGPYDLRSGERLLVFAVNEGRADVAGLAVRANTPANTCKIQEGRAAAVTLDVSSSTCSGAANTYSLCFLPGAGGTLTKSNLPGCDGFFADFSVSGSWSCNGVNLTYAFTDSGPDTYPGCSVSSTVIHTQAYSGSVALTWSGAAWSVGSNSGTVNDSWSSTNCSMSFPTCTGSDLQVSAAR